MHYTITLRQLWQHEFIPQETTFGRTNLETAEFTFKQEVLNCQRLGSHLADWEVELTQGTRVINQAKKGIL